MSYYNGKDLSGDSRCHIQHIGTLYGHVSSSNCITNLSEPLLANSVGVNQPTTNPTSVRVISAGNVGDSTIRLWKMNDKSQLVYYNTLNISEASETDTCVPVECISSLRKDCFITGDCNGRVSVWSVRKRRRMACANHFPASTTIPLGARTVESVCGLYGSDLVASGSRGLIRLWKTMGSTLEPLCDFKIPGHCNDIKFVKFDNIYVLLAAIGTEEKLSRRYEKISGEKNGIFYSILSLKFEGKDDESME